MMVQKHKFIEDNLKTFRKLASNGFISSKSLEYYRIYKIYMSIKGLPKMDRYKQTAIETNTTARTVRQAVAEMKKYVRS